MFSKSMSHGMGRVGGGAVLPVMACGEAPPGRDAFQASDPLKRNNFIIRSI